VFTSITTADTIFHLKRAAAVVLFYKGENQFDNGLGRRASDYFFFLFLSLTLFTVVNLIRVVKRNLSFFLFRIYYVCLTGTRVSPVYHTRPSFSYYYFVIRDRDRWFPLKRLAFPCGYVCTGSIYLWKRGTVIRRLRSYPTIYVSRDASRITRAVYKLKLGQRGTTHVEWKRFDGCKRNPKSVDCHRSTNIRITRVAIIRRRRFVTKQI